VPVAQRPLVGGAELAGVGEPAAGPFEEGVLAPRLAEDGDAAGAEDAVRVGRRCPRRDRWGRRRTAGGGRRPARTPP
jgi:hypothetical protein